MYLSNVMSSPLPKNDTRVKYRSLKIVLKYCTTVRLCLFCTNCIFYPLALNLPITENFCTFTFTKKTSIYHLKTCFLMGTSICDKVTRVWVPMSLCAISPHHQDRKTCRGDRGQLQHFLNSAMLLRDSLD